MSETKQLIENLRAWPDVPSVWTMQRLMLEAADELERFTFDMDVCFIDVAETDAHIRAVARRFLPEVLVYGDSNGVPTLCDVVDAMAAEIDRLTNQPTYVHAGPPGWQRPAGQAVMPVIPIEIK